MKGDRDRAERIFNRVLHVDSSFFHAYYGLADLCARRNELEKSFQYLQQLVGREGVPPLYFVSLAKGYSQHGDYAKARFALDRALEQGLDSAFFLDLLNRYPKLNK